MLLLKICGVDLLERLGLLLRKSFWLAGDLTHLPVSDVLTLTFEGLVTLGPSLIVMCAGVILAELCAGCLQTRLIIAAEPFRIDWKRINPVGGFVRLCSWRTLAESAKAAIVLSVLGSIGAVFLHGRLLSISGLSQLELGEILNWTAREGNVLVIQIITATAALAGIDYLYERWRTEKQLRMSRHEVREEMREQEGDPLLKTRLKRLRQRLTRRRMMSAVEKADVVITNPTHLAVALQYRAGEMSAPRVVGKGAGFIAERIREIARSRQIPLIEDRALARVLFQRVEIGDEIPESLYRAVAGVLAYVYRLRGDHARNSIA
jgi:flagellar biosynthetic protein FlhB